ncbi:hypothetical protein DWG18_00330 [Lysobacter sp. TY2-98]|uniref:2OG-Fe(II) oxygenase n=1 Tax=Lysobacter sp. TY2-98 TaxID=2290922 RepID=UPI000E20AC01|nr:2OG-Fe(II) oxygenase [Lysobacter sp. TY2-98]AXK70885.1 hypothetical protein DWG18_00330 [Lysobacter sp. TY2-98]
MTSFALPSIALPGDRLPDVWLRFADGERVKLHKAFGGRPLWIAVVGADAQAPDSPPADGTTGLLIAPRLPRERAGWRSATADAEWCGMFSSTPFRVDANLRIVDDTARPFAGAPLTPSTTVACAPVLQIPAVLEPELCRALIRHFDDVCEGGERSHVLVLEDGQETPRLAPDIKARRESPIRDPALEAAVHQRLLRRVMPELARVFQFQTSRRDPFKLLAYAGGDGYFRPHRDNDTPDVAHRRFALSVNLDEGAYDGGTFRFPEFGPHLYGPPTGDVLVFSCSLLHEVTPITRGTRHALATFVS